VKKTQSFRRQFLARIAGDQLLALFDLQPDVSFFLKNHEGRFVALNRRGREYCGVASEDEAIGKTDFDFFPNDRAQAYFDDDQVVMTTGQPVVNRIEASPEAIGSPRLVITNKIPVRNEDGEVVGVAGFSRQVEGVYENYGWISRFAKVVDYLHENFGEAVRTVDLARQAGLSESQFNRRFRQTFGVSARQYLLRIRVEAAAKQLLKTDESVSVIAIECGFYDHAHLTRSFQRLMRSSPTEYRRQSKA
jgi:PAS domain S-box-containing protein